MIFSQEIGSHELATIDIDLCGYYCRIDKTTVKIPVISSRDPGKGNMRRFLDTLPNDERIEFRCVMDDHLAAALSRRGFHIETIKETFNGFYVVDANAWVRDPLR